MKKDKMKIENVSISILGIGYTGLTQTICLASRGFSVIAYDINKKKLDFLKKGISQINEPELKDLLNKNKDKIRVNYKLRETLKKSNLSFISVGTPTKKSGDVKLDYLFNLAKNLGQLLKIKDTYHVFVIRSTVPMGTTRKFIKIIEKYSEKEFNIHFGCIFNPEFLREGNSVFDFFNPPFVIIGAESKQDANLVARIYKKSLIKKNFFVTTFEEAEFFKYANNAFHALKLSFINEFARVTSTFKLDTLKLIEAFILDKKLNISSYYLTPNLPFGGSCLTKDVKALSHFLKKQNLKVPVISHILSSNNNHQNYTFNRVLSLLPKKKNSYKIGFVGITFKENTDDLRESAFYRLFRFLLNKNYKISFYDPMIDKEKVTGVNLQESKRLPNFFKYQMKNIKKFIKNSDFILIGCGNGLNDLLNNKKLLGNKRIICLNPGLYQRLNNFYFEKLL